MLRLVMFGSVAAALVTLFDQGTLWQFTLDPARRLAFAAYWIGHATIAGVMLLRLNALEQPGVTNLRALAELAVVGLLSSVLMGLFVADGETLIEVALADAAPGAILIIVVALLLRMVWRMLSDAEAPLVPIDTETGETRWRDVLITIAMAPLGVLVLSTMYILVGATWRGAGLFLDYAVQGQAWAQVNWKQVAEYISSRLGEPVIYVVLCAIAIAWIILEKLLVNPPKPDGQANDSPQ
jgi:hypothetical protein